jgi:hypothetical protein
MRKYLNLSLLPLCIYFIFVADAHGGNDKAPFLVLFAALLSFIAGFTYILTAFLGDRKKDNLRNAFVSLLPFITTAILFILSRMGLVDILPILGFR